MVSIANRMLAGVVAVSLLPLAALAWNNDANAPATTTAASATAASAAPATAAAPATGLNHASDPLLQLLVSKGILSATEANGLAIAPAGQMRDQLLLLLKAKGMLSA